LLTPKDAKALIFPFQAGPWDPGHPGALAAAVGDFARTLGQHRDPSFGFRRLIDAARVHALDRYPPAIIATLSGKLRFVPVPDAEADPGYRAPVKEEGDDASGVAAPPVIVPMITPPTSLREAEDLEGDEEEAGRSDLANLLYGEVVVSGIRRLERLLSDPRHTTPRQAILDEAEALRATLEVDLQALGQAAPARLQDLDLLLEYLGWLLRNRPDAAGRRRKISLGGIQALCRGSLHMPTRVSMSGDSENSTAEDGLTSRRR